jgi:uncharacterized protein with HEPN domain
MKRDFTDYLEDILNAMEEVETFTQGMTIDDFVKDKKTINAVIRSFEVMGEAAKRIPDEIKQRYKDIPWKRVAGMRNKLIHEYFGVDTEILLVVIKEELPPLKPLVKKILDKMEEKYKNQVAF